MHNDPSQVHHQRLNHLVDRSMFDSDAYYHAQVTQFRSWLMATEMAMEDEEIDRTVIQRVLNRLVFATPDGSDAYDRQHQHAAALEVLRNRR